MKTDEESTEMKRIEMNGNGKRIVPKNLSPTEPLAALMSRPLSLFASACAAALLVVAPPASADKLNFSPMLLLLDEEEVDTISEGAGSKGLSVSVLSSAGPKPEYNITIHFTLGGVSTDTAIEDIDYRNIPDHVSRLKLDTNRFLPRSYTFKVLSALTVFDDNIYEGNEQLTIRLTRDCTGAESSCVSFLEDRQITIIDNDPAPTSITLTANPDSIAESATARIVRVTATVNGPSRFANPRTVWVVVGRDKDTATEGIDYATVPDFEITIPAGAADSSQSFYLGPTDDNFYEPSKTLKIAGVVNDSHTLPVWSDLSVFQDAITITSDAAAPTVAPTHCRAPASDDRLVRARGTSRAVTPHRRGVTGVGAHECPAGTEDPIMEHRRDRRAHRVPAAVALSSAAAPGRRVGADAGGRDVGGGVGAPPVRGLRRGGAGAAGGAVPDGRGRPVPGGPLLLRRMG